MSTHLSRHTLYMLDSNIFDRLLDGHIELSDIGDGIFLATGVQFGELSNIPSSKEDRKRRLIEKFKEVVEKTIPATSFALDIPGAGFDEAEWNDGSGLAEKIECGVRNLDKMHGKGRKLSDTNPARDSIIAETAAKLGAILVTGDANLAAIFMDLGYQAKHFPKP